MGFWTRSVCIFLFFWFGYIAGKGTLCRGGGGSRAYPCPTKLISRS